MLKQTVRKLLGFERFSNTAKGKLAAFLWSLLLVTGSALVTGVLSLYFGAVEYGMEMFRSYLDIPLLVALNLLPVIWLALLLWLVIGNPGAGAGLSAVIVMAMTMVNVLKIKLRNDPLLFEDLRLVSEAGGVAGKYDLSLTRGKWLGIVIALAAAFFVAWLTRRGHMRLRDGWLPVRLIGCAVLVIAGIAGWKSVYMNTAVYEKTQNDFGINHYNANAEYQSRGFVYPFLYSAKKAVDTPPEGYDSATAEALLAQYTDADIPDDKKVNVIAVMLEAYADVSELVDNEAIAQAYAPLHEIEAQSVSGKLVTNIFGGGTVMTERSFLTGYSKLGTFRTKSNSFARYFAAQGYTVEGSHPGYEWFYNRQNINENLGFSNYYFFENHYEALGMNQNTLIRDSDAKLFPELVNLMDESIQKNGQPYFSFSVSYQGHGPYDTDSLFFPDKVYVTPEDTGWSQESCTILNNYVAGVENTTEQIQAMLAELETREEPVVFVMFGDHLPWLGDNDSVYNELGMDIDTSTTQGYLNHYSTPFCIWANSAAKDVLKNDFTGNAGYISPNFLMTEVFEECGWEGNAYMQYLRTVMEQSSVTTDSDLYLIDGEITDKVSDEAQTVFDQYNTVQYYYRKNFKEAQ